MSVPKTTRPPVSDTDPLGMMAGEYRILQKLGSGGFGTVYEAEHPVLKRRAAVKVLHPSRSVDSVAVGRFVAEARAANQIRHRHIVDIFSFGELPSGQHFYVMDFLDGVPLDRFLEEEANLKPELALQLLRPVAQALGALHDAGIVHRDVKPANIYLAWDSNGEVVPKLLDFGLVKLMADSPVHTASGVPMGTPFYMSPEQCRGEKIDARSDIYAFGVICHEILTGTQPITGDSPAAVLVAHVLTPARPMSEIKPELPAVLDAPVLEMMAKEPAARPQSMALAFERLEAAARQAGISVPDGLPHLPRPSSVPSAEPRVESATFPATAAFGSGERAVRERSTLPRRSARATWGGLLAVVLLVGVASYLLRDMLRGAEAAPPPLAAAAAEPAIPAAPPLALPPAPAGEPPPAPPASVELRLHGAPPGAFVMLGDRKLGPASEPLPLPFGKDPLELQVSAPGFESKTISVVPASSVELDVALPRQRVRAKQSSVPRDLENPF